VGTGAAGLGLLAGCGRLPWQGRHPTRVPRVGFLSPAAPDSPIYVTYLDAFRQGLQELGYIEDESIVIESRYAYGRDAILPELAAELVRLPVDVIVTLGTVATLAAKQATAAMAIVFGQAGDPVADGLVASLGRPGGNVTGLTNLGVDLSKKRLELLRDSVPGLARVAFLLDGTVPFMERELAEAQAAAQVLGLQLIPVVIQSPDELAPAFERMSTAGAEAVLIQGGSLLSPHMTRLAELAASHRLPSSATGGLPQAGGLMSYGAPPMAQFHRAAYYVDRILKGTKPADLPVEQPMVFKLVVNLKTAQALGITFPHEIMLQVTEVIQ
jgi:putative tryptophan/tyrosine transport system substrate-binding protein